MKLTKAQNAARQRYMTLIADTTAADAVYDALPETLGGRIISTDAARFLDAAYRATPVGRCVAICAGCLCSSCLWCIRGHSNLF